MVQKIPKERMNIGQEPRPGMQLMVGAPGTPQFPAEIIEVSDTDVTLDLNHPLAGKTINFKIRILDIA
jgi:FKBP-type peptidyl-prolyl cis-trans isomerase 2